MSTIRRLFVLVGLAVATSPALSLAQGPQPSLNGPCFRARPMPECASFFLTNAGAYLTREREPGDSPLRAIVDWGVMVNTGRGHAIGGSWFVSLDNDGLTTGPVLRYRRWFSGYRSLDVALGTVAKSDDLKAGSLLGLVKYNPNHWFGVAVRPEYIREPVFDSTDGWITGSYARISAGVELGGIPGVVVTAAEALYVGIIAIIFHDFLE